MTKATRLTDNQRLSLLFDGESLLLGRDGAGREMLGRYTETELLELFDRDQLQALATAGYAFQAVRFGTIKWVSALGAGRHRLENA